MSKLKKVLREVASLPDGLTSPLVPWASSQRRLGWRSPAEVCDEVATLLCRGLYSPARNCKHACGCGLNDKLEHRSCPFEHSGKSGIGEW